MSETTASDSLPQTGSINYSLRKYETWKFKAADDSLILRVLPAMKSLIKRRDFGRYWKTHFGWKGLDERGKERLRPFLCIEEKRDKRITCVCDACELRKSYQEKEKSLTAKVADIIAAGQAKKATREKIAAVIRPVQEELDGVKKWIYNHGLDGKYRIPCMNKAGKLGLFLAPWNVAQKLRDRCRELQQQGIDACGVQDGVWFEFVRNGKASPTSDDVQPVKIATGPGQFKLDLHTLDAATLVLADQSLPDLEELMEKGRIRADQIKALVECSGDPEEVDRILEIDKSKNGGGFGPEDSEYEQAPAAPATGSAKNVADDAFDEPKPAKAAPAAEVKKSEPAAPAAEEEDEDAKELAALKAKQAAKKAKAAADAAAAKAEKPAEKAAEPAAGAADVSDADFDKMFA